MQKWLMWLRAHGWGMLVGVTVTLAVIVAYTGGWFAPASMWVLDEIFQRANRVGADDRVVMIDITDYAVERIHRWPWPRQLHARLIDTLNELGAKAVLMDIVFDSHEKPRLAVDPDLILAAGKLEEADLVYDDNEFRDALARHGNVFLATYVRTYDPRYFPDDVRRYAFEVFDETADIDFAEFERRMRKKMPSGLDWMPRVEGRQSGADDREDLFVQLRIERELEESFGLDEGQLPARIGIDEEKVQEHIAGAKRRVARRLVRAYRRQNPDADFRSTFEHILPNDPFDLNTYDKEDLQEAFRSITSEKLSLERSAPLDPSLKGRIRNAADFRLPYYALTEAANVGLVVFETDVADGVMRRVPLVVNHHGKLIKHIGFRLLTDELGIDDRTIRMSKPGQLEMSTVDGDREWRVQIDEHGRTLINWHQNRDKPGQWQDSFKHFTVGYVLNIAIARQLNRDDRAREALARADFVKVAFAESDSDYNEYARKVSRRRELRWEGSTVESTPELAQLESEIATIEDQCIASVREWAGQIGDFLGDKSDLSELTPDERRIYELGEVDLDEIAAETRESIKARQAFIDDRIEELRPQIQDKICLIGYTATAVADTVNTPVFDEVPGVMAHANLINTLLVNQLPFVVSSPWINVGLILLAGIPVTMVTTSRDPWFSLTIMAVVVVALFATVFALFYVNSTHVDPVGPFLAAFLCWAFVTLYRQLTEERQKRAFSQSLAQYTSPAIAEKLAENLTQKAGSLDLSPRACEVTCFFSDLKGFTSISERLGASRTREVLNPYLEAMSGVLIKHNAMINKFMGDGIFAFFNPPLLPVENHARAACEAALDSFVALEELKQWLGKGELEEEVMAFRMRIGVNSGEVFVGDYGSRNKLDYTCIGDTVNLSARLEPACKPFGIYAMISETTLAQAGDGYVVRHLGGLQVVGKKQAVQVYELIGRKGEVDNGEVEYAGLFGKAVKRFQDRDWDAALKSLEECRKARTKDLAADLLELNIRLHQETPPPDDWNQAIELTSK